jgi:uncharacterized membrane protein YhaH (DUF805 family)
MIGKNTDNILQCNLFLIVYVTPNTLLCITAVKIINYLFFYLLYFFRVIVILLFYVTNFRNTFGYSYDYFRKR